MPSTLQLTRPGPNRGTQPPSDKELESFWRTRSSSSEVRSGFVCHDSQSGGLAVSRVCFLYVNDWLSASRACAEASPSYSSISLPQASHPAERLTKRCYLSRISGPGALLEDQARQGSANPALFGPDLSRRSQRRDLLLQHARSPPSNVTHPILPVQPP